MPRRRGYRLIAGQIGPKFETKDPVRMTGAGSNSDAMSSFNKKERIKSILEDATELDMPVDRRDELLRFFERAPDETITSVSRSMCSVAESAQVLSWRIKLKEFFDGNPPPPKYETDKNGRTPEKFLEDVWGEYMDQGVLYQDTLSAYDPKLIPAIYGYQHHYGKAPNRFPPPKRERTEAILRRIVAQGSDTLDDILKAASAYARRGDRRR